MLTPAINLYKKNILILCIFVMLKICYASEIKKGYPYRECVPGSYYWQPFYSAIPTNTMDAGIDKNGDVKFVARIVSADVQTWSAPTTFSEEHMELTNLYFGWHENKYYEVSTYFVELLLVNKPNHGLKWRHVDTKEDLYKYEKECCLVEGGSGYMNKDRVPAYVGRVNVQGTWFVGGVYIHDWTKRDYMHYMDGWHAKYLEKDYDILVYDCCHNVKCTPPDWFYDPCCANYLGRGRKRF